MGARAGEVGRAAGGVGAAAVTSTGVKTELRMRGRDERPRGCGCPAEAARRSPTPTFSARMGEEETESPPPGQLWGRGQLWVPGLKGQGHPSHPLWSWGPGLGSHARQSTARPLRRGLAWVLQLGQLSWQQAVAGQPSWLSSCPSRAGQCYRHPSELVPTLTFGHFRFRS